MIFPDVCSVGRGMSELALEETGSHHGAWELPSSLQSLTIGENVHENMRMEGVELPDTLEPWNGTAQRTDVGPGPGKECSR